MIKKKQTNYSSLGEKSVHDEQRADKSYHEYRQAWSDNPKNNKVADFPLNIDLEVTNACNLKCPHCARSQKNWGDNEMGYIDEAIAKKVIDEIDQEGGYSMKFSLRGEPLLHSSLLKFLEWAKNSRMVDFYFNTNGMLLSQDFSKALVDLQIPRISISVGGWDEESFARCQVGAKMKVVKENIAYLKKYRDENKSVLPKIRIQAVLQEELKPHLDELRSIWEPLADEIGLVDFREETNICNHKGVIAPSFSCNFLWQRLVVLWDGSVYPCLFHGVKDNKDLYLGNVKDRSLKEMWQGPIINKLRKLHKQGLSHKNRGCDSCSYRASMVK